MKKTLLIVCAAIAIFIAAFIVIYTRPQTIEQRWPEADFSKCVRIRGDFSYAGDENATPFTIYSDDPDFERLTELFRTARFSKKLSNLLPGNMRTKYHSNNEGGYRWNVIFSFDRIDFSNGESNKGDLLFVNNFFGQTDISIVHDIFSCSVKDRDRWCEEVLQIIMRHAD